MRGGNRKRIVFYEVNMSFMRASWTMELSPAGIFGMAVAVVVDVEVDVDVAAVVVFGGDVVDVGMRTEGV